MCIRDRLTTGQLMSLFTYMINILMSLMMISMVMVMLTMSRASAERIVEVINEKASLTNPKNPIFKVLDGSIEFKDVEFAYKKDGDSVLRNINLSIN